MASRRSLRLDSLLLLFLSFCLVAPLFRLTWLDNFSSIESTFIAEGRILSEHLPHPGWQPLWYCGTRTDYIYPPALPYGTAVLSRLAHVPPAHAYHIYTAVFYVFGILAVYWLVRVGSGSRTSAWFAAAAAGLLSPSFLLLPVIRQDSGYWVPQRLHVLMAYGEGPHIAALCVIPAALAAAFVALRNRLRPGALALAGTLCALVVANNFYGATSLAILFPIMVWSIWAGERTLGVWRRAAAIVLIAYGLSAFWLTPSYVRITLLNLKWVAQPGNSRSLAALLAAILFSLVSLRWVNRKSEREWPAFVVGAAFLMSFYVLGFFYFGLRITGEPARLVPELDLVLVLTAVEILRNVWQRPRWRSTVIAATLIAFLPSLRYFEHLWSPFPEARPLNQVYEYKTAAWVNEHLPGARVLPSGTVRFWFDVWADNGQPDGGSMQGMLNQVIPFATWQITHAREQGLSILWLKALGSDAVIVPDSTSPNPYRDYQFPGKFSGILPVLNDDGHGTVIYRIPRLYRGNARVVDAALIAKLATAPAAIDEAILSRYVALVENPAQHPATLTWRSFDEAALEAQTEPGQAVLVQETWDPAWHGYENGKELSIRRDPLMEFMLIPVSSGTHRILMRFETPLENRMGEVLSLLTLIATAGLLVAGSALGRGRR